jgi:hypothetical protein
MRPMRFFVVAASVAAGLAFFYFNNSGNSETETAIFAAPTGEVVDNEMAVAGLVAACEIGTPVSGVVAVSGRTEVLSGPSASSKAFVNRKATEALGMTTTKASIIPRPSVAFARMANGP